MLGAKYLVSLSAKSHFPAASNPTSRDGGFLLTPFREVFMVIAPPQTSSLVQRIANPSPADRQARADTRRYYAAKSAAIKLRKMHERMAALASNQRALAQLTEIAEAEVPNAIDEASWRGDVPELADKIQREAWGLLEATEAPVRNADREIALKGLPPCIEVNRDDPFRH